MTFLKKYTDHQKAIVAKYYPTMTRRQIIERFLPELDCSQIQYLAKVTGTKHDEATEARINAIRCKNIRFAHTPEAREKANKSFNATVRRDRLRIKYGLKQKTRLNLACTISVPKRTRRVIYRLKYRLNYYYSTDDSVLLYDERTRRTKNENYFTEKYGILFSRAED